MPDTTSFIQHGVWAAIMHSVEYMTPHLPLKCVK